MLGQNLYEKQRNYKVGHGVCTLALWSRPNKGKSNYNPFYLGQDEWNPTTTNNSGNFATIKLFSANQKAIMGAVNLYILVFLL